MLLYPFKKPESPAQSSSSKQQQQPFLQNQEWAKFQKSIQVEGFQTGQITKATVLKKSKGGKQARNRKARELALEEDNNLASSDNRFPAIRYSPEETQELLQLAYDTLPKRDGKRGTRNLKRQENRWKAVRKIRATYKQNIIEAHHRRMEHRSWTRDQTKAVKEAAPEICRKDAKYQANVLKRWAATMYPAQAAHTSSSSSTQSNATE